jgi:L-threonylcarbamoyladenylate synthase
MGKNVFNTRVAEILRRGGVGVLPTDTIYGIVGSALSKKAVERIYRLRSRSAKKPMIVLIGSMSDLRAFGVNLPPTTYHLLDKLWPGKVTVVLPCRADRKFIYIHRGTKSIAFRLPASAPLRALLRKTGPLIAPSANIEGKPPALTVAAAKKYFGGKVDFYIDGGRLAGKHSTLIAIKHGHPVVLRPGAVRMPNY